MFQRNAAVCSSHESNAQKIGTRSECIEEFLFALHYTLAMQGISSITVGLIEEHNVAPNYLFQSNYR